MYNKQHSQCGFISGRGAGQYRSPAGLAGFNLHFLDRLLPLLGRVQRRVGQHVAFRAHGTEGRVALDQAPSANQPVRACFKHSHPLKNAPTQSRTVGRSLQSSAGPRAPAAYNPKRKCLVFSQSKLPPLVG